MNRNHDSTCLYRTQRAALVKSGTAHEPILTKTKKSTVELGYNLLKFYKQEHEGFSPILHYGAGEHAYKKSAITKKLLNVDHTSARCWRRASNGLLLSEPSLVM